ncbi:MAG: hypothetical protein MJK12_20355 [Colwellia sp.]|nr:hypothetical protein [Colwellia sp.]
MKFIITLLLLNVAACSISKSPPLVVHNQHGEMLADNPLFQKDAIECAQVAESNVGSTNGVINGSLEMYKFFSGTSSCISSKGWKIKEG